MTFIIGTVCGLINKLIGPGSSDVKQKEKKERKENVLAEGL